MTSTQDDEVRAMLDRHAIQQLIYRYSSAVTRGDFRHLSEMYAPDAVWESPLLDLHFDDAQSFIDYLVVGSAGLDVLIQTADSPDIELLGDDRARAATTMRELVRGTFPDETVPGGIGETNVDRYAIYFDELAKPDGRWMFTHRLFVPILSTDGVLVGDVLSKRPVLRPGD
jgi:hypothetical protein